MTDRLKEKIALITGGSSGIGQAAAQLFSREGAKVVIADINVEGGEETVRRIIDEGGEAQFVKTDVSKSDEVEALIKKIIEMYSWLDCAYNNAGIVGDIVSLVDHTEENWNHVLEGLHRKNDLSRNRARDLQSNQLKAYRYPP